MGGVCHLKSMSNRKSNQLSCWQALPAKTRWLVAIISLVITAPFEKKTSDIIEIGPFRPPAPMRYIRLLVLYGL